MAGVSLCFLLLLAVLAGGWTAAICVPVSAVGLDYRSSGRKLRVGVDPATDGTFNVLVLGTRHSGAHHTDSQ